MNNIKKKWKLINRHTGEEFKNNPDDVWTGRKEKFPVIDESGKAMFVYRIPYETWVGYADTDEWEIVWENEMQSELFGNINYQIKEAEENLKRAEKVYRDLITLRNSTCKHEYMTAKEQYCFPNSQYIHAHTKKWTECNVCGFSIVGKTIIHMVG